MKLSKLHQAGDTILEVLIAVTVLSLVLTTSFGLATRSTKANRQAEERGEASKIAQAEMEKLKLFISSTGSGSAPTDGEVFCMKPDATSIVPLGSAGDVPDNPDADPNFQSSIYTGANSPQCRDGVNNLYYKYIVKGSASTGTANTYTSIVRWPAVTGNGVDQVTVIHRIYPDLSSVVTAAAAPCIINNNVAISLDTSGSMLFPFDSTTNRMDAAQSLLRDFFINSDLRSNGNRAALSEFAGRWFGPYLLQPMTASYGLLKNALNNVQIDPKTGTSQGGTDIALGLDVSYNELEAAQVSDPLATRVLVLITDGKQEGNPPTATTAQVISRATTIKNDGVVVYGVGIYPPGSPDAAAGESLLSQVASTGGFSSASNPAELSVILDNISSTLDC